MGDGDIGVKVQVVDMHAVVRDALEMFDVVVPAVGDGRNLGDEIDVLVDWLIDEVLAIKGYDPATCEVAGKAEE